jgi:hypothetical protein
MPLDGGGDSGADVIGQPGRYALGKMEDAPPDILASREAAR